MRIHAILFVSATTIYAQTTNFTTGQLGDALRYVDNPQGAAYRAIATENPYNITAMITAVSAGESGTEFAVQFDNLPAEGGPFLYHIHAMPVSSNGNCSSTLAHLDPYIRGETPPCDPNLPETCQVGDLSGKHGTANGTSFNASFTDPYVSLKEGVGAFFGNRSFVLHFANTSRIACGNFSALSETSLPGGYGSASAAASSTVAANATSVLSEAVSSISTASANATSLAGTKTNSVASTSTSSGLPETVGTNDASQPEKVSAWKLLACFVAFWGLV
ncbi:uncharacterized protein PV09_02487 [Verruconis gallopava]|uniref:superoxide dismutase n=1 Tax=Verruconis gallopava TaxID=253628 RepID=A0A0D1Z1J3_9PEZI|nr:uncharacterized protein PV09_02487 [Verruconis gallopava]KIW06807.1 hypothetical protein PV09_02487 [Verruconis gallopava]